MSLQGIILIDVLALVFIVGVFFLLRSGRIYAGYAALWIASTIGIATLVSIPRLLAVVTSAVGAIFPVSALTLLAFVLIFVVLVLFSVKLTDLHERQVELSQQLAYRELRASDSAIQRKSEGATRDATQGHEPAGGDTSAPND